jgi:hypothetical protein
MHHDIRISDTPTSRQHRDSYPHFLISHRHYTQLQSSLRLECLCPTNRIETCKKWMSRCV